MRGPHMALPRNKLLAITPPAGAACSTFGVNHKMPGLKQMFVDGEASFMVRNACATSPM
jgi:hypothetical protein